MALELKKRQPLVTRPEALTGKEVYPRGLLLLGITVMTGLYCSLLFLRPALYRPASSFPSFWARMVGAVAGEHPILTGEVLLLFLAPAAVFPQRARPYLLKLLAASALLWGGFAAATTDPVADVNVAVEKLLGQERPMPTTIHGK